MSEWISVKDRLPEDFTNVWVSNGGLASIANVRNTRLGLSCLPVGSCVPVVNKVTHWMSVELPAPPEPKLTVREALKEATEILGKISGSGCSSYRASQVDDLLPRLRSALESEE